MELVIQLLDDSEAVKLFGVQDRNLKIIREYFGIKLLARGQSLQLEGEEETVTAASELFAKLLEYIRGGGRKVESMVDEATSSVLGQQSAEAGGEHRRFDLKSIARTEGQRHYLQAMANNDIVISIGPAGTGKTFLAVRMAVEALKSGQCKRLILCRPAVEAGESLGFLPGDFQAKVNPYLRPLYDALHSILEYDQVRRYTDREIIEIVPLAYMRGRTLSDAFIILDEGQNTTPSQMKMFLTRMGEGSKIVVTGDVTQVDLPANQKSGLTHARQVLGKVDGIRWVYLTAADIVRHPLVIDIVDAYDEYEESRPNEKSSGLKHRGRKSR